MAALALGDAKTPVLCVGLLRQQPDTAQGLEKRLKDKFAPARLTRGSASKCIPRLVRAGYVEVLEEGADHTADSFTVTPAGDAFFLAWLRQTQLPPAVRDVTQCKLEFYNPEELSAVIEMVKEQAIAYGTAANIAHEEMDEEERRRRERKRRKQPTDWDLELTIVKLKDLAKLGNAMKDRLNALAGELEHIQERFRKQNEGSAQAG
jgi:DNA-binding MarR family transcriptional regulator